MTMAYVYFFQVLLNKKKNGVNGKPFVFINGRLDYIYIYILRIKNVYYEWGS